MRWTGLDPTCSGHVGFREDHPFRLSRRELEALAERLLAKNAAQKQALAELRAEVARW